MQLTELPNSRATRLLLLFSICSLIWMKKEYACIYESLATWLIRRRISQVRIEKKENRRREAIGLKSHDLSYMLRKETKQKHIEKHTISA